MKSRAEALYGAQDPDALFKGAPVTGVPWPPAGGRKGRRPYDDAVVEAAVREGKTQPVDPRNLRSMQPHVTHAGVQHYMSGTTETFADHDSAGNKHPVVYERNGTPILLSGTHRATSALLRGEQFDAVVARGDYGGPR